MQDVAPCSWHTEWLANFGGVLLSRRILQRWMADGSDCRLLLGFGRDPQIILGVEDPAHCGSRISHVLCRWVLQTCRTACASNRRSRRPCGTRGPLHAHTGQISMLSTATPAAGRSRVVGDAGLVSSDPQRREQHGLLNGEGGWRPGKAKAAARRHTCPTDLGRRGSLQARRSCLKAA